MNIDSESLDPSPGALAESPPSPSTDDLKKSLSVAKKELSACALDNAWAFTIPAVAIAVPLSVRYKTYSPLVFAAVFASGVDYYRGLSQCQNLSDNVKQIKRRIAELEHGT